MKKGWIIALLLLLVGGIGAYVWYGRLKSEAESEGGAYDGTLKPRVEMSTLNITNIDDDQIDMRANILIDNPLPVSFKASRLRYTVYMAKTPIIEESYEKSIQVGSGDSSVLVLPMKLLVKKMATVLETLDKKGVDSTTYGFRAAFDLDVPILGKRTFWQTVEKRLPTIYLPKIKVEDIDLGKLRLKQTDVAAKVGVENRNKFPFNFTDTHYSITIDGKQIAEGNQPEPILIKAQATTPVVFPVTMKPGQAVGLVDELLFKKETTPYVIQFRCKLIDKDKRTAFNGSKMNTQIKGTLADLSELAKNARDKKNTQKEEKKAERKEERQERRSDT